MPAYNAEKYVADSIKSILRQSLRDFELVIVNDGSNDGTGDIVRSFDDPRIRLIDNTRNSGILAIRNLGMSKATGKYIAFLDADDISRNDRLEKQAAFLDAHPDFGVVGSWFEIIDQCGRVTGENQKRRLLPGEIPSLLLFNNVLAQSSVMIRREFLPKDPFRFPIAEDYDLWNRLARSINICILPEILVQYRIHSENVSVQRKNHMELFVREIIKNNLSNLRIEPTDEEMDIHRRMEQVGVENSLEFVPAVEKWLLKLRTANRNLKIYDPYFFERVLGMKWFYACKSAYRAGFQAFSTYRRSVLLDRSPVRTYQEAGFAAMCLFGAMGGVFSQQ